MQPTSLPHRRMRWSLVSPGYGGGGREGNQCGATRRQGAREGGREGGGEGTHLSDVVVDDGESESFPLNELHQSPGSMDTGEGGVDVDEEEDRIQLLELLQLLLALLSRERYGIPCRFGREGGRARRREGRKIIDGNSVGHGGGSEGGGRDDYPQPTLLQAAKGGPAHSIIQRGGVTEEEGVAGGDIFERHADGGLAPCERGREGGRAGR